VRRAAAAAACLLFLLGACRAPKPSGPEAERKLALLEEVLRERDDNDPRLDSAFDGLSLEAKRLFRARYARTRRELLNERGTIVYLLGRNLETPEDWAFLREVVREAPCLSLTDCSRAPAAGTPGQPGDEVTLAYPALVALRQAKGALERARGGGLAAAQASSVIALANASKVPAVARVAARMIPAPADKARSP